MGKNLLRLVFSNKKLYNTRIYIYKAQIAQLVEQWIKDPRVPSSSLGIVYICIFII